MVLAQDVFDEYGRVLVTAGMALHCDIVKALNNFAISFVWVREIQGPNQEISVLKSVINQSTRMELMDFLAESFQNEDDLLLRLPQLETYTQTLLSELDRQENLLLYLQEMALCGEYLFMHSVNVCIFAMIMGKTMGLTREQIVILGLGGLLHDLGKIKLDSSLINKQGKLTTEEFVQIKDHPHIGYRILKFDTQVDYRVLLIALQHHERYDGLGYPWGVSGTAIHLMARITAVADVYDAFTTDRVYRSKISAYEAVRIINEGAGTQFDPIVVATFNQVAVPFDIGHRVKLNNGISGTVIGINTANPTRPIIWSTQGKINLFKEKEMQITYVAS